MKHCKLNAALVCTKKGRCDFRDNLSNPGDPILCPYSARQLKLTTQRKGAR